ncbi:MULTISPECIES: DUF1153 domain-containing protein [Rhodovulum]|uniref:Uncharacterized protein DUF1153 n=2 Tax=Rhodovulum TaxID=34008 RepID=A0A8E2VQ55_9RHOB|nr:MULTISPECIES: DUF1153 domain-containing protein [Rhodovulum]PTW51899.1 uncharacterized protein DUF1153 [Rhodovulum kholense]RAP42816.1 hypothetical protein BYZ73_03915 [Rhodovulum viride]
MFLKRIDGPRTVSLPDGTTMSRADLPPVDTRRWVASRKAAVVKAVAAGLISEEEALDRYTLSAEEFSSWKKAVREFGIAGLKVTSLKSTRRTEL